MIELLEPKFNTLYNKINNLENENNGSKRRWAALEVSNYDFVDEMEEGVRRGKLQSISYNKKILQSIMSMLDTTVTEVNIKCGRLGKSGQSKLSSLKYL